MSITVALFALSLLFVMLVCVKELLKVQRENELLRRDLVQVKTSTTEEVARLQVSWFGHMCMHVHACT